MHDGVGRARHALGAHCTRCRSEEGQELGGAVATILVGLTRRCSRWRPALGEDTARFDAGRPHLDCTGQRRLLLLPGTPARSSPFLLRLRIDQRHHACLADPLGCPR